MKADLCEAFCNEIIVTPVPVGLAISTAFKREDGDRISFYVFDLENEEVRLEDDGSTIAQLEAAGVDFETDTRRRALDKLLDFAGAYFDHTDATIRTHSFSRSDIGPRALDFVSVMLRMSDFLLLTQERVASTFRDDAALLIRQTVGDRAIIKENEPVSAELSEVTPDMTITSASRPPVAIFFGNSASRVNDALFLHMAALHEVKEELSVIALLENDNSVPADLRRRASNRLSTVPVFREDEGAAVARIVREAIGKSA